MASTPKTARLHQSVNIQIYHVLQYAFLKKIICNIQKQFILQKNNSLSFVFCSVFVLSNGKIYTSK